MIDRKSFHLGLSLSVAVLLPATVFATQTPATPSVILPHSIPMVMPTTCRQPKRPSCSDSLTQMPMAPYFWKSLLCLNLAKEKLLDSLQIPTLMMTVNSPKANMRPERVPTAVLAMVRSQAKIVRETQSFSN